jgi:predicted ester cyclase
VFVGPAAPDGIRGRDAFREFEAAMRSASPDLRFVEHESVAEGERMATRFTMSATHAVEEYGTKLFSTDGMDLFQLRNGTIERINAYFHRLALAEQANVATVDTP